MLTFIPDIAEEHLEELQFLWTQRRTALHSAAYTMREMSRLEERIEAHVQGLLVLGEHLPDFVTSGLASSDEMVAFAAAYALLRSGTSDALKQVRKALVEAEGTRLEGIREALAHGPAQPLIPLLQSLFVSAPPPLAIAVGEALAFHRALQVSPEQLSPLLRDEAPAVRRGAWRIAAYAGMALPPALYDIALRDDDPGVKAAARTAAAWSGYGGWLAHCRALADAPTPEGVPAIAMLATVLPPQEYKAVAALAAQPAFGPERHQIAAAFGHPVMIDFLLSEMQSADPATAAGAGAAFGRMLGVAVDSGRRATLPPPNGDTPDAFEVEFLAEVQLPDVPRARDHWERVRPQLANATRVAHGLDVSAGINRETFAQLDMASRRELCLRARLTAGWSGTPLILEQFPSRA
ncbi:MAG TPA: hypothetical protein VJW73_23360 [Gemmatimonadaceae bacterium]|nr:hypothetical protein [Gemmatimonadaceae bacterium]